MQWSDAEAAIRAHIEAGWALTSYASVPLLFENDQPVAKGTATFMAVVIDGTFAEKSIYGSTGKRVSVEGGIVFFHAFAPVTKGKRTATAMVDAMTTILELQAIGTAINMEGGAPPSPTVDADSLAPSGQPGGTLYRCSGSVPFIVIGAR